MSIFEGLRDRVSLEEVVGRFSELQGNKALCVAPDHADEDPSMHVYEDHVHCYSCGFHGDVVDVWAAANGYSPGAEAAYELAKEYGVDLPEWTPQEREKFEKRRELENRYLKQARACYERIQEHSRVEEWWNARGFGPELRERFLLGSNGDGTEAIIPYWHRGRMRGLIRRRLQGEPKYLYPNAADFAGGYRPLFIPTSLRGDPCLVEGPVDALALAALGYNAAAVGGSSLSEQQHRELVALPGTLYALPDADQAGDAASRKWVRTLYPRLRLCKPEYGEDLEDPAKLYQKRGEAAREVLENLREGALDALDLVFSEAPDGDNRTLYRYAREEALPLLTKIEDGGEREAALQDISKRLKLKAGQLRKALDEMEPPAPPKVEDPDEGTDEPEASEEEVRQLVGCSGVLDRYVEDAASIQGVVQERDTLRLLALGALGSQLALLPNRKPAGANVVLTAEAGRGKNYLCDAVAALLPEEFYLPFESSSAKALYYRAEKDPDFLKYTWIYPNEAEAVDLLVEMLRPLISGGSARHLTVNKDGNGRNADQELNAEGPISVVIPTVRNKLDAQLQTRMLVSELADYEGRVANHSRAFSRLLLPDHAAEDHSPKVRAWRTALRGLAAVRRVVFPLEAEQFCLDSDEVSHGARLWANLLGLMLAHAWLEQRNREVMDLSGELAVVATPDDYAAAYGIFETTCERSVVNLSDTHRKILDAVYGLNNQPGLTSGHSLRAIAERAELHHSTVAEHKTFLTKSAKLLYEVDGGGLDLVSGAEPSWWGKTDLLAGFPRPAQVRLWWENHSSVPDSARQARHPEESRKDPHSYGENGVGHPTRQGPDTTRQSNDDAGLSGWESAVSGEEADSGNGLDKPETAPVGTLSGVSGVFADKRHTTPVSFDARAGESVTLSELTRRREDSAAGDPGAEILDALHQHFESRPEARQDSPAEIAKDLYWSTDLEYEPSAEIVQEIVEALDQRGATGHPGGARSR